MAQAGRPPWPGALGSGPEARPSRSARRASLRLFEAWGIASPDRRSTTPSVAALLAGTIAPHPDLRVVEVAKHAARAFQGIDGVAANWSAWMWRGPELQSFAIEHEDPVAGHAGPADLGLDSRARTSTSPGLLKHALDLAGLTDLHGAAHGQGNRTEVPREAGCLEASGRRHPLQAGLPERPEGARRPRAHRRRQGQAHHQGHHHRRDPLGIRIPHPRGGRSHSARQPVRAAPHRQAPPQGGPRRQDLGDRCLPWRQRRPGGGRDRAGLRRREDRLSGLGR